VSAVGTKLTIQDCEINDNVVTDGAGGGVGVESGPLTISNSTLSGNSAFGGGGGLFYATTSAKTVTITNSTISGNSGNEGAGILVGASSKATIRDSTISDNTAVEVVGSPPLGGGIFIDGKTLSVLDSTISGNVAEGSTSHGGGICNLNSTVTLNNVTVADNTAAIGGGIDTQASMSSITSGNSIIADNGATVSSADCAGTSNRRATICFSIRPAVRSAVRPRPTSLARTAPATAVPESARHDRDAGATGGFTRAQGGQPRQSQRQRWPLSADRSAWRKATHRQVRYRSLPTEFLTVGACHAADKPRVKHWRTRAKRLGYWPSG